MDQPTLLVFFQGDLDFATAIDENTGEQRAMINNLEQINDPAIFQCNAPTKDCDYWTTSAYDPLENKVSHFLEQNDVTTLEVGNYFSVRVQIK